MHSVLNCNTKWTIEARIQFTKAMRLLPVSEKVEVIDEVIDEKDILKLIRIGAEKSTLDCAFS